MVRIIDEGSHFEAPIDRVWKLIGAHRTEFGRIHTDALDVVVEPGGDHYYVVNWHRELEGRRVPVKIRATEFPPLGRAVEILAGPMAGTKIIYYYTPKGPQTAVTAIGEFRSPAIPEARLEGAARGFLNGVFEEDTAYLAQMK
ncbi:MAG: hypothetical protein L3K14_08180 [Thermoplasmata archaeon]|nr:hypothetical protein [Thermoplasmata archaeon]